VIPRRKSILNIWLAVSDLLWMRQHKESFCATFCCCIVKWRSPPSISSFQVNLPSQEKLYNFTLACCSCNVQWRSLIIVCIVHVYTKRERLLECGDVAMGSSSEHTTAIYMFITAPVFLQVPCPSCKIPFSPLKHMQTKAATKRLQ